MKHKSPNTDFKELVGMKVLLAEEAPSDIGILRRILEDQGLNISMASEASVLFNLAPRVQPDLILMDAQLRDADGYEACQQLKSDLRTRGIPVLLIQARNGPQSIGRAFSAGAADYINKPYRVEEILARVKHQLQIQKLLKDKQILVAELNREKSAPPAAGSVDLESIPENLQWEALRSKKNYAPFCVLLSNIDDFDNIKDKLGSQAEGRLLSEVQNMLKGKCRRLDEVTVWGMEEFLVLLPGTELKGGVVLAEKYQAHLQNLHFDLEDDQVRLTMSFGISQFDPENKNDESAMAQTVMRAKESLNKVKSSGKSSAISIG